MKEKIPHTTAALTMGIVSFIGCCCFTGFTGIILSGVALYLTKKGEAAYAQNPEAYDNYNQLKTAKIVAIVSLILSAITAALYIILRAMGIDEQSLQMMMEEMQEMQ